MPFPVEDPDVQFIFQFLDQQAQGGLRQPAGLCCLAEMPEIVDGDDWPNGLWRDDFTEWEEYGFAINWGGTADKKLFVPDRIRFCQGFFSR